MVRTDEVKREERLTKNIASLIERLRWKKLTTPVRNSDVVAVKLENLFTLT